MTRIRTLFALLPFLLGAEAQQQDRPPAPQAPMTFEALAQQAQFIFRGRVQKVKSSNLRALAASDRTAVVRIEEVLDAPLGFEEFTKRQITVELREAGSLREGQEAIFFTNGWLYGETLAVKEVGHRSEVTRQEELKQQVTKAQQQRANSMLLARLKTAELVVVGKVSRTQRPPETVRGLPGTEHDPEWQEAVIQVDSFELGRLESQTVTILFPTSRDVQWFRASKFVEGQGGIWLLRKLKPPTLAAGAQDYYTALDPLDFQPLERREHVRTLIQRLR